MIPIHQVAIVSIIIVIPAAARLPLLFGLFDEVEGGDEDHEQPEDNEGLLEKNVGQIGHGYSRGVAARTGFEPVYQP